MLYFQQKLALQKNVNFQKFTFFIFFFLLFLHIYFNFPFIFNNLCRFDAFLAKNSFFDFFNNLVFHIFLKLNFFSILFSLFFTYFKHFSRLFVRFLTSSTFSHFFSSFSVSLETVGMIILFSIGTSTTSSLNDSGRYCNKFCFFNAS